MDRRRSRFLSVLRENSRLVYDHSVQDEITRYYVVLYLPTDLPAPFPVRIRPIDAATVDYVLSWRRVGIDVT